MGFKKRFSLQAQGSNTREWAVWASPVDSSLVLPANAFMWLKGMEWTWGMNEESKGPKREMWVCGSPTLVALNKTQLTVTVSYGGKGEKPLLCTIFLSTNCLNILVGFFSHNIRGNGLADKWNMIEDWGNIPRSIKHLLAFRDEVFNTSV